jgi:RNA polymerase-binding transcription factor DksA
MATNKKQPPKAKAAEHKSRKPAPAPAKAKARAQVKPAAVKATAMNSKPKAHVPAANAVTLNSHSQPKAANAVPNPFMKKQKERLLQLRDNMLDSMAGVSKDTLRSRAEGSEASAFGMHQADAGSDAYDRDFALSLLSQEQDALYEIDEAIKRVETGNYGTCDMCMKSIPHIRLEALPFARFCVGCQGQIERQTKATRLRQPVTSLFGLTDEEGGSEAEEEEPTVEKET